MKKEYLIPELQIVQLMNAAPMMYTSGGGNEGGEGGESGGSGGNEGDEPSTFGITWGGGNDNVTEPRGD